MKIHSTTGLDDRSDKGFTLVEILIAIVLVGILAAVAVVGISNLVSKGSSSACTATADSAKAATAVYFASHQAYPADFLALTVDAVNGPALTLPAGVSATTGTGAEPWAIVAGIKAVKNGSAWTLTMDTTKSPPTFTCS
ncbi:MAG TPA: type II secretion system protein [Ilumatobacteraceae bacterium]